GLGATGALAVLAAACGQASTPTSVPAQTEAPKPAAAAPTAVPTTAPAVAPTTAPTAAPAAAATKPATAASTAPVAAAKPVGGGAPAKVWFTAVLDPGMDVVTEDMIQTFNKEHRNVEVRLEAWPWDGYPEKLITTVAAGA